MIDRNNPESAPLISTVSENTVQGYRNTSTRAWLGDPYPEQAIPFLHHVRRTNKRTVIDLASGPATIPRALAKSPQADGINFICVDSNEDDIDKGRKAIQQEGLQDRIQMVHGNLIQIPEIPELMKHRGKVHLFESYGPTTHLPENPSDHSRSRYYAGLRNLVGDGENSYMFLRAFTAYDHAFYDYKPLAELEKGNVVEVTGDAKSKEYPILGKKYPGIFQHFFDFPELKAWLPDQGFDILEMHFYPHPRPDVAKERFVWEIIAKAQSAQMPSLSSVER